MSRRPLPPVEGSVPLESGVGPAAGQRVDPAAGELEVAAPPVPAAAARGAAAGTGSHPGVDVPLPAGLGGGAAGVPRAEEFVQRPREIPREQVNALVPKELQLRRRMRIYQLDHEVELRDQVALAVDEWLRGRGY